MQNRRQSRAPPLAEAQAAAETWLCPVVAHASYLVNLTSPDADTRRKSVAAMVDELGRCGALGVSVLIFHPGSHMGEGVDVGVKLVAHSLNLVHRRCGDDRAMILLETTAGQGTSIGHRFEQLVAIRDRVSEPERLGICLDTCHLLAAGYDFRTADAYAAMIDQLDRVIELSSVKCIHLNDSQRGLGSRIDRHEPIGMGSIGKPGFAHYPQRSAVRASR